LQYCSSDCGYLSLRTQVLNAPSHFQVVNPRKTYGPAADMCSLGCTVLEMLTRQIPYPNVEWVCHISTSLVLILWYLTCRILKKICCAVIVHSINLWDGKNFEIKLQKNCNSLYEFVLNMQ
jgi:serine/threonine protein kinase